MRARRRAAAVAAVLGGLAGGCAGSPGPSGPVTPIRAENLFMSPSGEPFRGGRDEPYVVARWFAQADADHDGALTRAEFAADADRAFRRFDKNGDGVIDGREIAAYEETVAPEILPRIAALGAGEGMDPSLFGGRRGHGEGARSGRPSRPRAADRSEQGAGLFGLLDEPEPITAADSDLDGRVIREEWSRRTDRRFDLIAEGATTLRLDALAKTTMQMLWERRLTADAKARGEHRPSSGGAPQP